MTAWDPPLDTGLAEGARILSAEVEENGYTPTECHAPGVYILRCSRPDMDLPALRGRWRAAVGHDHIPPWLDRVAMADRLYYVGAATNIYERLADHCDGHARQVGFCEAFPPHHLKSLWFDEDPFEREYRVARLLEQAEPDAYVHQR